MNRTFFVKPGLISLLFLFTCLSLQSRARRPDLRVLLFTKSLGYYHVSIPDGVKAIQKLGREHHFRVDTTTSASLFTDANLKQYAAVIFLSTSGNMLDSLQQLSFRRYIEGGGGFMGIHSASASEKTWTWYGQLVGAVFINHPEPQTAIVDVVDTLNASTRMLPRHWTHKDEWYNFKNIQPDLHILLKADETTYTGGTNGNEHPLAWYREFDGGRSFYTALGHFSEAFTDPLYLGHILAGIEYAMHPGKLPR